MLSPFANACPKLQTLRVSGAIGSPLLAVFGTLCKQLISVEAIDVPHKTFKKIGNFMPRVTSTHLTLFAPRPLEYDPYDDDDEGDEEDAELERYLPAISSCNTLTSLNTRGEIFTDKAWRALPPCLKHLYIYTPCGDLEDSRLPSGLQLPNLQSFCTQDFDVPLCMLSSLLNAAPLLRSVDMQAVEMSCSVDQILELVLLCKRLSADLVITARGGTNDYMHRIIGKDDGKRLHLCIRDHAEDPSDSDMLLFASKLPVLEGVVGMALGNVERPILAEFTRAFPRLRVLGMCGLIESGGLPDLSVFPLLQSVKFTNYGNSFSMSELEAMCLQTPSLLFLDSTTLEEDHLDDDDDNDDDPDSCVALMAALKAKGRTVDVGEYSVVINHKYG